MPVFNAARTLDRALASVCAQSLADWELVVVDDGSEDATPELLRKWAAAEPRVRVICRPHFGIVAALNAGLAACSAGFIARMDADDESHPSRLAEQAGFLERHPSLGLVGSLVEFGGNRSTAQGYALHVDWMNSLVTPEQIALGRFVESPFAHPSVMFRHELVEGHGGYRDGDFPEDFELWLRWLEAGVEMGKVPSRLLTWHDLPGRLSRNHVRYDPEAFHRCKAPYLARWIQRHVQAVRPILVWGAGRLTRKRAEHLTALGVRIDGYIDIDPEKWGRRFGPRTVIAPQALPLEPRPFVLGYVAKRGAHDVIRSHLSAKGYIEGRDFLLAA